MTWLNPALLWFALLALVPLLLHFLLRERVQRVAFSAVRFLRRQSREVLTRHRWLERLLTVLRMACVLLLIAGFARPFLADRGGSAARRELIVMLDVSRSMLFSGRFAAAQAEAATLIEAAEPGTAVTVVTFSDDAGVAVYEAKDRADALATVARAKPSGGATDILAALDRVLKRLAERKGRGDVHLVSDLQASGVSRNRDVRRLVSGYRFHVHPIGTRADNDGIAVEGSAFSSDITPKDNNLTVSARVFNRGKARDVEARLLCDGKPLAARRLALPQNGETVVALTGTVREIGSHAGQLQIVGAPSALPDDDRFYFVARVVNKVRVAVVRPAAGAQRQDALDAVFYLAHALNAGPDSPFQAESHDLLPPLNGVDAVILAQAGAMQSADVDRLAGFLRGGGGLLVGLAENVDVAAFNAGLGRIMPARLRSWAVPADDIFLVPADTRHPLVVRLVTEGGGDVTTARFHGSWDLKDTQASHVILRFNDNRPALLEGRCGKGIIMLLATGFDPRTGDFPLRAIFVPFVQESLRLLLARSEDQSALAAGDAITVPQGAGVLLPDGSEQRAPASETLCLPAAQPGIYQVRHDGRTDLYAANAGPRESDLTAADPQELQKLLDPAAESELRKSASGFERVLLPGDKLTAERRLNVGWWCLCALAVLLALELWLAGMASRK